MTFAKCKGPSGEYWDYHFNYYSRCSYKCNYGYCMNWRKTGPIRVTDKPENLPGYIEKYHPSEIMLCNSSDAYQPAERRLKATRHVLDWWLDNIPEMPVCILTKSPLVLRDVDYFTRLNARVGVTITTFDSSLAKAWEPFARHPVERLNALYDLHEAGVETWVSCEPCLDEEVPFKLMECYWFIDKIWIGGLTKRWYIAPWMKDKIPEIDYKALGERILTLLPEKLKDRVMLKKSMRLAGTTKAKDKEEV